MIIITHDKVNKEVMITFHVSYILSEENMCVLSKHTVQVTWNSLKSIIIQNGYFSLSNLFLNSCMYIFHLLFVCMHPRPVINHLFSRKIQRNPLLHKLCTRSLATQDPCRVFLYTNSVTGALAAHPPFL